MSTLIEEDGRYTVYSKGAIDNLIKDLHAYPGKRRGGSYYRRIHKAIL